LVGTLKVFDDPRINENLDILGHLFCVLIVLSTLYPIDYLKNLWVIRPDFFWLLIDIGHAQTLGQGCARWTHLFGRVGVASAFALFKGRLAVHASCSTTILTRIFAAFKGVFLELVCQDTRPQTLGTQHTGSVLFKPDGVRRRGAYSMVRPI
jgi:hypothetical protein